MARVLLFRPSNGNTLYVWNGSQVIAVSNEQGQVTDQDLLRRGDSNEVSDDDASALDRAWASARTKVLKLKSSDRKDFTVVGRVDWDLF